MTARTGSLSMVVITLAVAAMAPNSSAQGRGDGGIVVRENAPVYKTSTSDTPEIQLNRGDAVAGITTQGILGTRYQFEEENGRLHVLYFKPGVSVGAYYWGWMVPGDLVRFFYDCGCDSGEDRGCRPTSTKWMKFRWNTCFIEARDAKKLDLEARSTGAQGDPTATGSSAPAPAGVAAPIEKPLTNDDVLSLVRLDLGDDLVIAKIQQAPSEALDVSTDALVKLKANGVSKEVLDSMIKRAGQRK